MASEVPVRPDARVILALGGHEFTRRRGNEAIVAYMLALAPSNPRICLLPTASGDAADQIAAFRDLFRDRDADVSHVSLFRLEHERLALREHLLAQDLIYVGGGSMVNLLAIWNAHGVAEILLEAWRRGTILAGQSAGAMCWFDHGISRSAGRASVVEGLGIVEGTLSVHYHRDPDRRDVLLNAVRAGHRPAYGADDGAGLLIRDRTVAAAISGAEGAGAWRVDAGEDGEPVEIGLDPAPLASPRPAIDDVASEVTELRRVRESRAGMRRAAGLRRRG